MFFCTGFELAGPQQFPPLIAPPTSVGPDLFAPAPAPAESTGAPTTVPKSSVVPSTGMGIGFPPANGPAGSASGACSLASFPTTFVLALYLFCMAFLPSYFFMF